jgi:hypothetical protein
LADIVTVSQSNPNPPARSWNPQSLSPKSTRHKVAFWGWNVKKIHALPLNGAGEKKEAVLPAKKERPVFGYGQIL